VTAATRKRLGAARQAVFVGAALGACQPRGGAPAPRLAPMRVRVRAFSEATAVRSVAAVLPYVFVASDLGLERWDLRSDHGLFLTAEHGLPGGGARALAVDAGRRWLWIGTDGGITRYDIEAEVFADVPPPPPPLAPVAAEIAALAPAGAGGVWIGGPAGLAYAEVDGTWQAGGYASEVTALLRAADGSLWIGTRSAGLLLRRLDGAFASFGKEEHCDVERVRLLIDGPDGSVLAVGESRAGTQRIAVLRGEVCATFRSTPDVRWIAAARRREQIVVLAGRQLYGLTAPRPGARRLARDGMRLVPIAPGSDTARTAVPYVIRALEVGVPHGATALGAVDDDLLIGTRAIGTARVPRAAERPRWLRRGELVGGQARLSVACARPADCLVAAGGRLWRFDGAGFAPVDSGYGVVLAVVRAREQTYVLYRAGAEGRIRVAHVDRAGKDFAPLDAVRIETPGTASDLAFARFSPRGQLWVGLRYRDEEGELRPYGVAEIDLGLALVAYHHASHNAAELEKGVLPIPIDVTDIAFLGDEEVWLASSEGATRIKGRTLSVHSESRGDLLSDFLRGVAITSGVIVFVASRLGVGMFDGARWESPAALRREDNALAVGPDGRLWMATPRGLAVFDGARLRRLDARRGLLEDAILDVVVDRFGRVWALGKTGLNLVTLSP
jgi:hypothetical protein